MHEKSLGAVKGVIFKKKNSRNFNQVVFATIRALKAVFKIGQRYDLFFYPSLTSPKNDVWPEKK